MPALLAALDELGVAADDLAGVAVTHIHLDHAGGVGDVAAAFPQATVYVHERGARHLVDPTRLVDSAAQVYGDLLDSLYGRLTPTPSERVQVLADGDELVVSTNRTLTTVDSPGHAKHHLALHDSESGLLFAGDAVGVRLPDVGVLRPATPPPDFAAYRKALRRNLRQPGSMAALRALVSSVPFLAVTGNVPTNQFNRGAFQELYRQYQADFPSTVRAYCKRVFQPTRGEQVPVAVRQAWGVAAYPCAREQVRGHAAERPAAEHEGGGGAQPALSLLAEPRQQRLPVITLEFVVHGTGSYTPIPPRSPTVGGEA